MEDGTLPTAKLNPKYNILSIGRMQFRRPGITALSRVRILLYIIGMVNPGKSI
jgi:hypothetical protein